MVIVGLASVQAFQAGALSRLPSSSGRLSRGRGDCCVLSLRMSDSTRNEESAPKGWWNQLSRALFPSAEDRRKAEVEMRRRREGQRRPKLISVQAQVLSDVVRACCLHTQPDSNFTLPPQVDENKPASRYIPPEQSPSGRPGQVDISWERRVQVRSTSACEGMLRCDALASVHESAGKITLTTRPHTKNSLTLNDKATVCGRMKSSQKP